MKKIKTYFLSFMLAEIFFLCFSSFFPAQAATEVKLIASDVVAFDAFGTSVAISHDVVVVGARGDDSNHGSAYVYRWNGTVWNEEAKLTASDSDGTVDFGFGKSVAIANDVIVVGSYLDTGSAYVYRWNGSVWNEEAKLTASDGALSDGFGLSVAAVDDLIVVGAYGDDSYAGSAYVYGWNGSVWVQEAKLTASDRSASDYFGLSVTMSNDVIAVGAYGDNSKTGSTYVYRWNESGGTWNEETKLIASDGGANDYFGASVTMSDDVIAVGAYRDSSYTGSAYVYHWNGSVWNEEAKLIASDGVANDYFGASVTMSSDAIVVGAYGDDDMGSNAGSAYVYRWDDGGSWTEETKLKASDGGASDLFGYSVAMSRDVIVAGALYDNERGTYAGSAYIYTGVFSDACNHSATRPVLTSFKSGEKTARSSPKDNFDVRSGRATKSKSRHFLSNGEQRLTSPSAETPSKIALQFLKDQSGILNLSAEDLLNFQIQHEYKTQHNGVTHLIFDESYQGIPVFQGQIKFAIDRRGQVVMMGGEVHSGISIPITPQVSASEAFRLAVEDTAPGSSLDPQVKSESTGPTQRTIFQKGIFNLTDAYHGASLIIFPQEDSTRLAWQVLFHKNGAERYLILVDAQSGAILYRVNLVLSSTPEGIVFEEDPGDASQILVSFLGDLTASPSGWLFQNSDGTHSSLGGNNSCAQEDRDENNLGGYSPIESTGVYSYTFQDKYRTSGGTDGDTDLDAAITNLFYGVNFIHDYYYNLGFDEAAGNFQDDNFGRGGLGNDPVYADAQNGWDVGDRNCDNFYTPPDGYDAAYGMPRLEMCMFESPSYLDVDDDFNGDAIIHEYTHGLSTRLVGGPNVVDGLRGVQSGAMGEGWADWFAASIYDDPVFGEYSSGDTLKGIREYALDANPLTYGKLCDGGCEVHDDGEIFSAALWRLRELFITAYGSPLGVGMVEQLVVDGMKFSPTNPSMLDMRDALLAADAADANANQDWIWQAFACRGMGVSATTLDHNDLSPVEAFDLPDGSDCSTACVAPDSGDWTITRDCKLFTAKTWSENLYIQNGAVMTIPAGISLDLDFAAKKLVVQNGSGLLVQQGGTLR